MRAARRPRADGERRGLLAGAPPLAPPWTDAARLLEHCTGCGACAEACPQQIIAIERGTRPVLAFDAPCTFCAACAEACPEEVFDLTRDPPWQAVAVIGEGCLEPQGIGCRACEDACEARALRARPQLGGTALMQVDTDACTGCGACVPVCPVAAIDIRPMGPKEGRDAA